VIVQYNGDKLLFKLNLIIKRGLKLVWFKTDAVTFIFFESDSDRISFKPRLNFRQRWYLGDFSLGAAHADIYCGTQNEELDDPRTPSCLGRHVEPLVPAAFAVVSTHQPAWPACWVMVRSPNVYVTHKENGP
jgi:hypothetical protein